MWTWANPRSRHFIRALRTISECRIVFAARNALSRARPPTPENLNHAVTENPPFPLFPNKFFFCLPVCQCLRTRFTITAANSMALANAPYDSVFPATQHGAIVLPPSPHPDRPGRNASFGMSNSFNANSSVRSNLNESFAAQSNHDRTNHEGRPPDDDMDIDI